ncbi:NAD(P)H-hydrate dehydratase [Caldimonas tepidiphila]|uniref:NAD(P)H-hydrate dehydratase n=1 Tax=Caldimonas tepidiphila TaxID=2315841 RepID=UPI000E5C1CDD|nr:NAD(P)H-hydrate dehydratase [Caldimonas tepidiphila]
MPVEAALPATHPSPLPVLPDSGQHAGCWPLHGVAASRAIEAAAQAALPPHTLMQRAGLALARLAQAIAPHAAVVQVLAGPGNNGGDGLEAAMLLKRAGRDARVALLGDAARLPADAAASLQRALQAGVPITGELPALPANAGMLVIDALLGLGSSRPPEGCIAEAIAWMNAGGGPVLAADLPSGLDADTGRCAEGASGCVRAHHTLALLTLKPGLFTGRGREQSGRIWFDPLGVALPPAADALLPSRAAVDALLPRPGHASHKGSRGDVLVVGGAPGMSGAALLAARAALLAGAGRVYLAPLGDAPGLGGSAPELMLRPELARAPRQLGGDPTVVCGCGGGDAVREVLPGLLSAAPRLVLDADGLNAVAADAALRGLLAGRSGRGQATVLTPHPLEAARLLGSSTAAVQHDRIAAATRLAAELGAVVVLKGSGSVIAAAGATPAINPSGNAALASAGTGDVLAGWLGGLWAQGLEARDAALAAVHAHGAAADSWLAGGRPPHAPLTASRLIETLHEALQR